MQRDLTETKDMYTQLYRKAGFDLPSDMTDETWQMLTDINNRRFEYFFPIPSLVEIKLNHDLVDYKPDEVPDEESSMEENDYLTDLEASFYYTNWDDWYEDPTVKHSEVLAYGNYPLTDMAVYPEMEAGKFDPHIVARQFYSNLFGGKLPEMDGITYEKSFQYGSFETRAELHELMALLKKQDIPFRFLAETRDLPFHSGIFMMKNFRAHYLFDNRDGKTYVVFSPNLY